VFHTQQQIGPYTLIQRLGQGGFGQVWLAEKRGSLLTTQVALKLPLDPDPDLNAVQQEAHVWLQASGHPNVPPVIDAEVYNGQVVIVSEYAAGGSLASWLKQHGGKAPSVEAAVTMIAGILAGGDTNISCSALRSPRMADASPQAVVTGRRRCGMQGQAANC